jgi:hypothetical protein
VTARRTLYGLLGIVAAAAAVLSFAALRDLALVCGFTARLAWLLPVVVDAGAAAGSLVWLGGQVGKPARRFARGLALGLLGLSVVANALGHGLAAFALAPPWWVIVAVSAIAPAVLGAVVHLAVLVGRPPGSSAGTDAARHQTGSVDERDLSRLRDDVAPAECTPGDRAAELITAGTGRRRLARELGISEYEARRLLDRARLSGIPEEPADSSASGRITDSGPLPDTAGLPGTNGWGRSAR